MKIIITESQLLVLLERQHISDKVLEQTKELRAIIENFVTFMEKRNPELTVIRGHDDIEIFGREFDVKFIVRKTDEKFGQLPQIIDFDKNKMLINTQKFTNGKYDYESFHDALSHELMHGYQRFKKNKPLIGSDEKYEDAVDIILGKKSADDFTKLVEKDAESLVPHMNQP